VVPLLTNASLEQAEEAGSLLLTHGITTHITGHVGRGGAATLLVADENFERACDLLGFPKEEGPSDEPLSFHPCPSCRAGDPLWYGKRKALLFVAAGLLFLTHAFTGLQLFLVMAVVALAAFVISLFTVPEFECRRCHRRWSRNEAVERD
jgi:hypothetical protein